MTGEDLIVGLVERGELRIDAEGRVWRIRARIGGRGAPQYRDCDPPRRAENLTLAGYLQVRAMVDGRRHVALAHRVVYRVLVGTIADGKTVNHLSGCKTDNRPSNLAPATPSEQALHARHVLGRGSIALVGERHPSAKLSNSDRETIRRRRSAGESLKAIAGDYRVAFQTISKIARSARAEI